MLGLTKLVLFCGAQASYMSMMNKAPMLTCHVAVLTLLQDMLTEQKQSEAASASESPFQPAGSAGARAVQATDKLPGASDAAIRRPGLNEVSEPIPPYTQSSEQPKAGDRLAASDAEPLNVDAETSSNHQDLIPAQSRQSGGLKQRWPGLVSDRSTSTGEDRVDWFGSANGKPSRDLKMDPVLQLAKWRESIFGSRDSITESRDSVSESIDIDGE